MASKNRVAVSPESTRRRHTNYQSMTSQTTSARNMIILVIFLHADAILDFFSSGDRCACLRILGRFTAFTASLQRLFVVTLHWIWINVLEFREPGRDGLKPKESTLQIVFYLSACVPLPLSTQSAPRGEAPGAGRRRMPLVGLYVPV